MYEIGVDEAGRGCLAGPVAVGLARVPAGMDLRAEFPGLDDSKRVPPTARERLYDLLERRAVAGDVAFSVVFRDAAAIDERGIAVVIREAIGEGLAGFGPPEAAGFVRLDGALRAPPAYAQKTIVRGDALVPSIMLASIAAKVARDRLMLALDAAHPAYGFARHKGYGTKAHYAALLAHGPCALHRSSFLHLDRARSREYTVG